MDQLVIEKMQQPEISESSEPWGRAVGPARGKVLSYIHEI